MDELPQFEYGNSLLTYTEPHIRLLELLPDDDDNEVRCNLAEYAFNETCPEYETLSYVWGDPNEVLDIHCNGYALDVTRSLRQALLALQDDKPRMLWIDQICINQSDDAEKTQQVGLMRDIYRRSTRTIAWLGRPDERTRDTFQYLRRITKQCRSHLRTEVIKEESEKGEIWEQEFSTVKGVGHILNEPHKFWGSGMEKRPEKSELQALRVLLRNKWFTRMWIIQEAALSPKLDFQSGSMSLPFDFLVFGAHMIYFAAAGMQTNENMPSGLRMLTTMAYVRYKLKDELSLGLGALIASCRFFSATDARDRFYALYGLSPHASEELGLLPDYETSKPRAVAQATFALLKASQCLDFLELAECANEPAQDMMSWIPAAAGGADPVLWKSGDTLGLNSFEDMLEYVMAHGICDGSDHWEDDADPELDEIMEEVKKVIVANKEANAESVGETQAAKPLKQLQLNSDNSLIVHAQLYDRIIELCPTVLMSAVFERGWGSRGDTTIDYTLFSSIDDAQSWVDILGATKTCFSNLGSAFSAALSEASLMTHALAETDRIVMSKQKTLRYPTGESLLEAYRQTICAGRQGYDDWDAAAVFERWRKQLKPAKTINAFKDKIGIKGTRITSMYASAMVKNVLASTETQVFFPDMLQDMFGRRMAWTAKGYLAVVPARTEVGDYVCGLHGATMPFVLRRNVDAWKLIGATYSHGMMAGELFDEDAGMDIRIV